MTVFREKISILTAKISDDLFLVIHQVFLIFPFISQIFRFFTMLNVVYDPFHTRKTTIFRKISVMTPFKLCSCFNAHPTTLLLKILGEGRMHGPSPTSSFGGTVPQSPPPVYIEGPLLLFKTSRWLV